VKGFDPRVIGDVIEKYAVTDADFSPTALRELLTSVATPRLRSLRRIVSGVEELSGDTQRLVFDSLQVALFNLYGPTEVSVSATSWRCDPAAQGPTVPIGRPMDNVRCYVLDAGPQLVAPGHVGELFIGGDGLARGYLRDPALTATRFVPDMVSGIPGARLYRTGDLVRLGYDGVIEFAGRADEQINLRGYRVEPVEVAAAIRGFPGVLEAVVASVGDGAEARLVAYLVSAEPVVAAEMRGFLRKHLPDYMIPANYVRLDTLPLTAHGKLDRSALPVPDEAVTAAPVTESPRDDIERELAHVWRTVLGVERLGIHDSFFDLGGESLKATRIAMKAGEALGMKIGVAAIFDAPTIAELAEVLRRPS